MFRSSFCLFLMIFLCFSKVPVQGQVISERLLEEKTSWSNAMLPSSMLYITTDKTIYLPTEVIWFAGYLLPYSQKKGSVAADMLSVALVSERGEVLMRKTYAIDSLLFSGSLTLTDSIPPETTSSLLLLIWSMIKSSQFSCSVPRSLSVLHRHLPLSLPSLIHWNKEIPIAFSYRHP